MAVAAAAGRQRLLAPEQAGQHKVPLGGERLALVNIRIMGPQGAQHLLHLDAVPQPPQRHMEQQRQAQLVHGAVFGQLLRQRQQHPVDLGAQSVVILRQQGFFHLLGVEIGHPGGALLLHLGEEIDRLVAHKGALLGAAVGLLVGLGQHPRLGAQVADPGGEGHARLVPGGLLDGFDVGPDVIGGDLVPAAVEDHQVLPVQQKGQPVEPAPRQGGHGLPHPAPEGHLVGALVSAVAVQDERRDLQVVQVDARLGQHGQKAVGVLGGRHPAQQRGQSGVEVPQHALGDLGPAQPLVVHGGFQPAERLLKIVDVGGLEQILGHMVADGHISVSRPSAHVSWTGLF